MAAPPPRRNLTPTKISKQHLTPYQILLQMGFQKHRAEKALAATGNRGVQLASDWLLAHVNDPFLDECQAREYILYACPTGPFLQQLENFWAKSQELCGWNGAHNFIPHITLVSFFKAPDECAPQLSKALKQVMELVGTHLNRPIHLEMYTSQNFMGFFVTEDDANYLKRLALQYVKEISHSIISDTYEQLDALVACFPWCGGVTSARCIPRSSRSISLEPHVKSLHLTLAYQFPSTQFNALKELVETLDPGCAATWELRLYSRDARLATKQVHKVLYPHTPTEPDELELRIGDYIYLNNDVIQNSTDGWVEGISWLTGISGYLPESYVQRTAESDAWTMHRTIQLCKSESLDGASDSVDGISHDDTKSETKHDKTSESAVSTNANTNTTNSVENLIPSEKLYDVMAKSALENDMLNTNAGAEDSGTVRGVQNGRKVFVIRHGERIDFTFGVWIPYCFDEFNNYTRKDLNMPKTLPRRENQPNGWKKDSPLTNVGVYQAKLTGEGLKDSGTVIDQVFCSPSYRCIQTCTAILEAMGLRDKIPICVEPGLFEWLAWYQDGLPDWMTPAELIAGGYNIKADYVPYLSGKQLELELSENLEGFFKRNSSILQKCLENTTGNILIVAHASSLDTCTRQLVGEEVRSSTDLTRVMMKVPYCSLITIEEKNNEWNYTDSPCFPLTHTNNQRFDWKILKT